LNLEDEDSKSHEMDQKHIDLEVEEKKTQEDHFEIDTQGLQLHGEKPEEFTTIPTKTVILSTFLLVTGISFIIAGIASLVGNDDNSKTISFLVFGSFLSIPGIYYTFQLCQAYTAETPEERQEILDEIPV